MRGKFGLVVGLGAGYVLGTRAGRERYEQIKKLWLKVWHLDPVQKQVGKVKSFAKAQALAVPRAVWKGAAGVIKTLSADGTPGQKLDAAIAEGKDAAEDVVEAAEKTAAPAARKPAAKKTQSGS